MDTLRPLAAALCLCGAIVVAVTARQAAPIAQPGVAASDVGGGPADARSPRNANYEIDARLDEDAKTIRGRETIRWRNITDQPTSELQFHLYWNAWRDAESTWLRERRMAGLYQPPPDDAWSSLDVTSIHLREPSGNRRDVTGGIRFIAPDDGNERDRTVMSVPLGRSVGPNEEVEVDLEWTARIPRPFARTGWVGDSYFIAQWFPKLGVLESTGWNTHQFHAATEFYSDFGVYDVRLTVPNRFIVGASGRQSMRTENADGTTTHRYQAEDIHDFAWTASPDYIDLSQRFEHPTLPPVDVRLLLQSERSGQADRYFAIINATLKLYGEWFGAYPYGYITVVDPAFQSDADGMEYPTFLTGRSRWLAPDATQVPESTTAHEVGHQWWYGIVATNEFEHAWMDEGINTYATARVLAEAKNPNRIEQRYFGTFLPWSFRDIPVTRVDNDRLPGYRLNGEADAPATSTYRYWPSTAAIISYNKTALWLHTLEQKLGWPMMQRILSTYFERWKFKHPTPSDFFDIVREVSGEDHARFFDEVYRSSNTFDYGVQEFRSDQLDDHRHRTTVVVRRLGEATSPVDVVTSFENGEQIKETWDGRDRRVVYVYERPSRGLNVQVDPDRVLLLDIAETNNSRTLRPRGAEASLKWSLKWMVWLQDLMLTYGFFV
ncbi:MAG TPA: M1 family metallopeptidase [Vicinamibacterales bacterium]|nr:M1 family metallopeptidase [Vicinamibacterales bacterium]